MPEDVNDRDSGKVVWLTTCNKAGEAHLILGRLQNEGIRCFLTNENISVLAPHFSRMFGGGVMIMVDEQDASKAAEILGLKGSEALVCPQCGSKRIKTRLGRHRCRKIFAIAISFLSGLPMHNMQFLFICKDCGKKFTRNAITI